MKGTIKKLNLKRETLRELSRDEAQAVHGGGNWVLWVIDLSAISVGTFGSVQETCSQYCSK